MQNNTSETQQRLQLRDMKTSGIQLQEGQLAGLANIGRWGQAELNTR